MHNPGLRNPRRNLLISIGITVAAYASLVAGVALMRLAGEETTVSALMIGLALLPAIFGPFLIYNFRRGEKVFAAIRRGEKEIGRWTVSAAELAEFRLLDDARNAHGGDYLNAWTPPREPPPAGIELIFVADGVLAGDTYFSLVTTGMFKFTRVGMVAGDTPALEFATVLTWADRFATRTTIGVLRLPVSRGAAAEEARVLDHFQRVDARDIVINPGFYRGRMRAGLIAAPIFFAVAAIGLVLKLNGIASDSNDLSGLLIGLGAILGLAALILALLARMLGRAQLRKR